MRKPDAMNRVFRYRLYPNRGQVEALEGQLDFARDLYNAALEQRRWAHRLGRPVRVNDQALAAIGAAWNVALATSQGVEGND